MRLTTKHTYTLKDLYRATIGEAETPYQRRIDAQFRRLDARRRRVIQMRLKGKSYEEIGQALGIHRAAASSIVRWSLERIRKAIAGEPRYNKTGRPARKPKE